jgi:transcriptional regulator with GAF, ATPase, and Fis domain
MDSQDTAMDNQDRTMDRVNYLSEPIQFPPCHQLASDTLCEPFRFERVVSELSTKFINLPADEIDQEIVKGLREIVLYTRSASAILFEFSEGSPPRVAKAHKWSLPEVPLLSDAEIFENLQWGLQKASSGSLLVYPEISKVPEAGVRARIMLEKKGFSSAVGLPLTVGGRVVGVLALYSLEPGLCDLVQRIKVIGQAFGNALSRKNSEEALRQAMAELKALKDRLEVDNLYLQQEIKLEHNFGTFVGESSALKILLKKIEQVSNSCATVLITGETGTGKELVASAIHELSPRSQRPLVKINCGALPPTLIESELFGHEKGAFTGAFALKIGRFEFADKSTLFLDEIAELPLELQSKLLRVLQEGEFERVGSSRTRKVDVRIIAATNRDLQRLVAEKNFREDLFYRLNVFPISCPPLRERPGDIPALVRHFVEIYKLKTGKNIESISQKAMAALMEYSWPGNVRELQNVIERAILLTGGTRLEFDDCFGMPLPAANAPLRGLHEEEREYIMKVLRLTAWRVSGEKGAAKILCINPKTLESKMRRLGIRRPRMA